jgi:hypothetical protein
MQLWRLLCAVVDVGWSQDLGRLLREGSRPHPDAASDRTMSQICGIWCGTRQISAKFTGHFSPIVPPFPARGLSLRCRSGGSWWRKFELLKPGFVQ